MIFGAVYIVVVLIGLVLMVALDVHNTKNDIPTDEEDRQLLFLLSLFWPLALALLIVIMCGMAISMLYRNLVNFLAGKPLDWSLN